MWCYVYCPTWGYASHEKDKSHLRSSTRVSNTLYQRSYRNKFSESYLCFWDEKLCDKTRRKTCACIFGLYYMNICAIFSMLYNWYCFVSRISFVISRWWTLTNCKMQIIKWNHLWDRLVYELKLPLTKCWWHFTKEDGMVLTIISFATFTLICCVTQNLARSIYP
jgi:hypothetical protein